MRNAILTVAVCATVFGIGTAQAATDEEKCLAGRAKAAGKYIDCVQKWESKYYGGGAPSPDDAVLEKLAKCRIKYAGAWDKLQGLGTTCAVASRYTDNGNGTITDNLTGLVWEKKSDNGDVHDKDATRSLSTGFEYHGNGTAFTTFLRDGLNAGAGFAGANDWRVPTFAELHTIVLPEPYPCITTPCVDAAFNTGCVANCTVLTCSCTQSNYYWSATTFPVIPSRAWAVNFIDGDVYDNGESAFYYARAVRGGL